MGKAMTTRQLPGYRNINELIRSTERPTLPPRSIQPKQHRRRKKVLKTERERITAASIIGALVGATGYAMITRK